MMVRTAVMVGWWDGVSMQLKQLMSDMMSVNCRHYLVVAASQVTSCLHAVNH